MPRESLDAPEDLSKLPVCQVALGETWSDGNLSCRATTCHVAPRCSDLRPAGTDGIVPSRLRSPSRRLVSGPNVEEDDMAQLLALHTRKALPRRRDDPGAP
jgi:hypothetical protein